MNNVSIIGRLGQDPELRVTTSGKNVASFSVAIENRFRDSGEPDWVAVEVWGKTAEVVAEHKNSGDQVAITGRLTTSKWTDAETGAHRSRTFITAETVDFLHSIPKGEEVTV